MSVTKVSGIRYEARCTVAHFKPNHHQSAYSVKFIFNNNYYNYTVATFIRLPGGPTELILQDSFSDYRKAIGHGGGHFEVPVLSLLYDAIRNEMSYRVFCQLGDDRNDYPEWTVATSNLASG